MLHQNSACRAHIGIDNGRPGDDDAGELVQLPDRVSIDGTRMGDRGRRPEQPRHQVGRFGVRVFAPVVLEAWDRQFVRGESGAVEEDDAVLAAHLPLPRFSPIRRSSARMRADESSSLSPAPISAFICWVTKAAPGNGVAVSCALSMTIAMSLWCSLTLKPGL